jgi:hypothetical protein
MYEISACNLTLNVVTHQFSQISITNLKAKIVLEMDKGTYIAHLGPFKDGFGVTDTEASGRFLFSNQEALST